MTENWLSSTPLSYVHVPLRTIPPGSLTFHGSFAPGQLGEWFRSQISCRAGGRPRAASFFKDFSAAGRAAHQTMRTKDKLESVDFNAAVAQFRAQISCRVRGRPRAASFFKDFFAAGRAAHQTMRTKDKLESVDFNAAVAQFRAQISCRVRGRPRAASFFKDFFAAGCAAHQTMGSKRFNFTGGSVFSNRVASFCQIFLPGACRPRGCAFSKLSCEHTGLVRLTAQQVHPSQNGGKM